MKTIILILSILGLMTLTNCGGGNDSSNGTGGTNADGTPTGTSSSSVSLKSSISLSGVKGFAVTQTAQTLSGGIQVSGGLVIKGDMIISGNVSSNSHTTNLVAIDASGRTVPVSLVDGGNLEVESVNTTEEFIVFSTPNLYIGETTDQNHCPTVIAQKNNGALYCNVASLSSDSGINVYKMTSSTDGELLYTIGYEDNDPSQGLYKIEFTDMNSPTITRLLDVFGSYSLKEYNINYSGDLFVSQITGLSSVMYKIYLRTGGLINLGSFSYGASYIDRLVVAASGSDNFYFMNGNNNVLKATKNGSSYQTSNYYSFSPYSYSAEYQNSYNSIYPLEDKIYLRGYNSNNSSTKFLKIIDPSMSSIPNDPGFQTTTISFSDVTALNPVYESENALIIASSNPEKLYRINNDDSVDTINLTGSYTIDKIDVSTTGEITFYGQRYSDSAKVIGTVHAGSTSVDEVNVVTETITVLKRIN